MKNYLPYVFPTAAAAIVLFLAFRWYSANTDRGEITPFADGVEINQIDETSETMVFENADAVSQVDLTAQREDVTGSVRYEVGEDTLRLSVQAALPESEATYQVWFKDPNGESIRKAFKLVSKKGGYLGSASLSAGVMPFEVIVTEESVDDDSMEQILLQGLIEEMDQVEAEE